MKHRDFTHNRMVLSVNACLRQQRTLKSLGIDLGMADHHSWVLNNGVQSIAR
jgi:hypothetical protein